MSKAITPPIIPKVEVCNLTYYDIRAGKCPFAKVYHGKIFCVKEGCK
jgi:hypothetical protein